MSSDQEAQEAIAQLSGRELGGRALNVNEGAGALRGGAVAAVVVVAVAVGVVAAVAAVAGVAGNS
jgi:hypothetical protein